jgi:glycosyltransferase involved in cell wall biosynthesis
MAEALRCLSDVIHVGESMKVDVYSMMKNEIHILPYFLRHYEEFADRIFVWDAGSDDGTLEMLQAHPKVIILPLEYKILDDDYARFNLWTQYKIHSRGQADWVMCVDADEFLYHPRMRRRLRQLSGIDLCYMRGYMMIADGFPQYQGKITDIIKKGLRDRTMDKPVLFRPHMDVLFQGGRHRTFSVDNSLEPGKFQKSWRAKIMLLHYRYFGLDYFMDRLKRNCDRMEKPYKEVWRCPDRSIGSLREWYINHVDEAAPII